MLQVPPLADIERAAVVAWPALERARIGNWLWRHSRGGSGRANSVACLEHPGMDVESAIDEAELCYRALGAAVRFQVTDVAQPSDLDARLERRGYRAYDHCTTLCAGIDPTTAIPADVDVRPRCTPEWLEVYAGTITPDRAAVAPQILAGIPETAAFVAARREDRACATVLVVVVGEIAIIECVATAPDCRRQGSAQSAVVGAMAYAGTRGARYAALGAVATNAPAQALYRKLGFEQVGSYRMRIKE